MRRRDPNCKVLFIGAVGHMEEKPGAPGGLRAADLPGSGLSRKKEPAGLKQNIHAVNCVLQAVSACKKIFREFQPDAVIGTGGYASFPALYAGSKMGIPTCVHESNAVPGVTTKMIANRASRVLVAFEESVKYYDHPEKVEVVGMPVQEGFLYSDKKAAREKLGLGDKPVVLSAFGSLGAKHMNELMAELMCLEKEAGYPSTISMPPAASAGNGCRSCSGRTAWTCPTLPASICGSISTICLWRWRLRTSSSAVPGAATCNEIAVSGTPSILIPSPNVTNNHQERNARVLSDRNAAVTIVEKDCTAQVLFDEIGRLLADPERRENMSKTLKTMAPGRFHPAHLRHC